MVKQDIYVLYQYKQPLCVYKHDLVKIQFQPGPVSLSHNQKWNKRYKQYCHNYKGYVGFNVWKYMLGTGEKIVP